MRYDKRLLFCLVDEVYDHNTGDYKEDVLDEHIEYGSFVETDVQTMRLVYGEIRQGSVTVHLQNKVPYTFNRVAIDGKTYTKDQVINQRVKQAYILSECQ